MITRRDSHVNEGFFWKCLRAGEERRLCSKLELIQTRKEKQEHLVQTSLRIKVGWAYKYIFRNEGVKIG